MKQETHPAVEAFIERMGLSAEADGLPRIAGRMWGFFMVYGGPCSFADLAQRLQVSRGSISTNARILRDLGIIERVTRPGDRQDYYRLTDDPYHRLMEGYIERMRRTVASVKSLRTALDAQEWEEAQQRLEQMQHFYASAVTATEDLIRTLQDDQTQAGLRQRAAGGAS